MSWRLLRRFLVYASLILLGLLMLTLAGAGYLLHSEKGSRWLVEKVQQLAPGELQLGHFGGSFTGPLQIRDLLYHDGDLSLEIQSIRVDWRPAELLEWRLHLTELSLQGARLNLPIDEAQSEPAPAQPFTGLSLPLDLVVESLRIEDFQLFQSQGAEPVILDRLLLQASAKQRLVEVTRLEAAAFSAQVMVSGNLELSQGLPVELQTEWSYRLPDGPELRGQGEVTGSLRELHVQQTLAAPIAGELDATLFELEKSPRWESLLDLEKTDIGAFVDGFPARLSGRLQSSGTVQRLEADGRLEFFEPSLGRLNAEFQSHYTEGVVAAEQLLVTTPNGLRLEAQGTYSPDDEMGVLAADLNWSGLRWPLTGEQVQFLSQDGSLHLEGRPADYRYRLDLDARFPAAPPALGRLIASGSGNLQGLIFEQISLAMQEGKIAGSGDASWLPEPSWQAALVGESINPGLFHEEFPGNLSLVLTTEGQVHESVPHAEVVLQRLEGELRGYPLQAVGAVRLAGEQLKISAVEVHSGANRLDLQGAAGEILDLGWILQAPELESLWPGLSGDLNAKGMLTGKAEMPRVEVALESSQVAFREKRVGELKAELDLDLAGSQRIDLQLKAGQLALGDQVWDGLLLDAGGQRDNHHIEMQLTGRQAPQLSLGLNAGLDEDYTWNGELQRLTLELQEFGNWALESPAVFSLGQRSQSVQRSCLKSAEATLCGSFAAQPDKGWKGAVSATELPFSTLQHWLPEETRISGRGNLTAEFMAQDGGALHASADLEIPEAGLMFELGGEPQDIDFSGSQVTASLDGQAGRCKLNLPLAGLGGIQGDVSLPGLQALQLNPKSQVVEGQLNARIDNLGLLSALLPNLQNLRGAIAADFKLGGTLAAPGLKGEARLQGGALDVSQLGLELRDLELKITANDLNPVSLDGSVRSGDGELIFSGETRLNSEAGFPTELQIKGEDWVAVNIPEAEVHVSPDINIKYNSKRSELNGEVHVPYARIRPREMPKSAVSGSPDLVVVGGDSKPAQKADPGFYSKLRISFGERVSFEGMGLRANLSGNLLVTDEPGRPVTGSGRVGVVDGTYKAYGQDLKIERGYALFADSPVDNPGLDVRAVREVEDVTAGLRVTGTLKNPELSLFSTPAMSESEVLSYLLTGRAPGESGGESVGVSAALQAAGAGNLASEIGRQFGLEELRVDTGGTLEEASVVAGTYLSPRLYVQYVNELATGETILRLRYDLTKSLQIQTETGQSQGVDLFYIIER
ncbi:MAG: translocation/assembly module TamB domain-containing protein [Pseudomonadota bacterium]